MPQYFIEWWLREGVKPLENQPKSGVEPLVEATNPQEARQLWPSTAATKLGVSSSDIKITKVVEMRPDEIQECLKRESARSGVRDIRGSSTLADIARANALLRDYGKHR